MEYYEEDVLSETIKEIIQVDSDLESRKNLLSMKFDFNLPDLKAIFDRDNKGHITYREFCEVYDLYRIYPRSEYLRLVFRQWDKDLDGMLSLHEFVKGICPKDKNYREMLMERGSYNKGKPFNRQESFTPQTTRDFVAYLKALTQSEERLE